MRLLIRLLQQHPLLLQNHLQRQTNLSVQHLKKAILRLVRPTAATSHVEISTLLQLNGQTLEKAEKRKAKKQLRIEPALDFLNSHLDIRRQNLFA